MDYNLVCEHCGKEAHIELGKNRELEEDVVENDVGFCLFCGNRRDGETTRLEPARQ